jgi:4-diphosphocytidyl-2-C-methyl-D-erythritol kinase
MPGLRGRPTHSEAALVEHAAAKINLTLRVLSRRSDGFHEIDSLVVFARLGDELGLVPGEPLGLALHGSSANTVPADENNLVLKATRALAEKVDGLILGHFTLTKDIPVAAGLGGGSADAAAALRLLAKANRIALDDPRIEAAARSTGADVPACLTSLPRVISGVGDRLSAPLEFPTFAAVLANPGTPLATADVYAQFDRAPAAQAAKMSPPEDGFPRSRNEVIEMLAAHRNDLEEAAIALCPAVAEILAGFRSLPATWLARMSGSGPTCFALFKRLRDATAAARRIGAAHPQWWVRATVLGLANAPG